MEINSEEYLIFKGLQLPLELMGIRGKFILYAAGTIAASFFGFIIAFIAIGTGTAFFTMFISIAGGLGYILYHQKHGLHSKRRNKGVYIYSNILN